jgi:nicotinamide mononucleotide adenylyltransferase
MCTLGAEDTSTWLMVDPWEAFQDYQRTAVVLDHFDYHINTVLGGARTADGEQRNIRIMLLAGSDLISTMSEPGVWSYADVCHFLPTPHFGLSHSAARPYLRPIWNLHRRAGRLWDGPSHR